MSISGLATANQSEVRAAFGNLTDDPASWMCVYKGCPTPPVRGTVRLAESLGHRIGDGLLVLVSVKDERSQGPSNSNQGR
jgi:hypothetical protein